MSAVVRGGCPTANFTEEEKRIVMNRIASSAASGVEDAYQLGRSDPNTRFLQHFARCSFRRRFTDFQATAWQGPSDGRWTTASTSSLTLFELTGYDADQLTHPSQKPIPMRYDTTMPSSCQNLVPVVVVVVVMVDIAP